MERLLSISQIARELGIPLTTVRYYRDTFAAHMRAVGSGRHRLYPEETLDLLRLVSRAYAAGLDREEIEQRLADGGSTDCDPVPEVQVHHQLTRNDYRELVTSLLEGEQERRELLWQMVREISRFGQAIEQQHFVLNELVEHLARRPELQLLPGNPRTAHEQASNPHTWAQDEGRRDDLEGLRRALANEQELVERLRRSKLDLEHRAAAAEAELEELRAGERGIWTRIFGQGQED